VKYLSGKGFHRRESLKITGLEQLVMDREAALCSARYGILSDSSCTLHAGLTADTMTSISENTDLRSEVQRGLKRNELDSRYIRNSELCTRTIK